MRVLFIPFPVATHYLHQVSLAWAFRSAGHDVRIAAGLGQRGLVEAITRSGMVAVLAGHEYDIMAGMAALSRGQKETQLPPEEFHRQHKARLDEYGRASESMVRDLVRFGEWWRPDMVVADPTMTVAPVVAERSGAPLVRQLFGIDMPRLQRFPGSGGTVEGVVRDSWPGRLLEMFDRFGVEVRADYAARTVDPCPLSMNIPELPPAPNRVPIRYVPYNGPGVLPDWLTRRAERPRVLLTWGTVATATKSDGVFVIPQVLAGLAGLDVEVVAALSRPDRERLGEPPAGVRVIDPTPLHLLLPTCSAIFHHGGGGAMLTAAALGVPQVIFPHSTEQAANGAQLAATGAGICIEPERADRETFTVADADADAFKVAVSGVLSDEAVRAATVRLRADVEAQPTPSEVVRVLEDLVDH